MRSSEQLIAAARGGDHAAFGRLAESSWSTLVAFARVLLASHHEAEDVVQDALLDAWHRLGTLRDAHAFDGWLRTIVYRRGLAHLRYRKRFVQDEDRIASGTAPPNQASGDIARALASLSPRQRAVIYLGEIDGRSDAEIATALGVRPTTVRIHRMRARDRLRAVLEEKADATTR